MSRAIPLPPFSACLVIFAVTDSMGQNQYSKLLISTVPPLSDFVFVVRCFRHSLAYCFCKISFNIILPFVSTDHDFNVIKFCEILLYICPVITLNQFAAVLYLLLKGNVDTIGLLSDACEVKRVLEVGDSSEFYLESFVLNKLRFFFL